VTLPSSPLIGLTYLIKDCTGSAAINPIVITPSSGNIDGSGSVTLTAPYQSVAVTYTGTQWSAN
jgi:hypothetical protein